MHQNSLFSWAGRRALAALCSFGVIVQCGRAAPESNSYASPDGLLLAKVVTANKRGESRVEIHKKDRGLLVAEDYSSPDGEHGQAVCHAGWTPDSQFFVFSTQNTGGHAPWARPTFFYSRKLNRVIGLDKLIGAVTECAFGLRAPDLLETKTLKPGEELEGVAVKVSLHKLEK